MKPGQLSRNTSRYVVNPHPAQHQSFRSSFPLLSSKEKKEKKISSGWNIELCCYGVISVLKWSHQLLLIISI